MVYVHQRSIWQYEQVWYTHCDPTKVWTLIKVLDPSSCLCVIHTVCVYKTRGNEKYYTDQFI